MVKLSIRGIISYKGFEICVSLEEPSQRYQGHWQLFVSDIQMELAGEEKISLTTIMHIGALLQFKKEKSVSQTHVGGGQIPQTDPQMLQSAEKAAQLCMLCPVPTVP